MAHNAESDAPIRCVVCNVNSEGTTYLAFINEHANHCRGCGIPVGSGSPTPDHCGECPPWTCDGCGQPCSMAEPCACWISLEGMALADIKGLLALGDISVTPPAACPYCGHTHTPEGCVAGATPVVCECGVWDNEPCPCGHGEELHERETDPEFCLVCGDAERCVTPPDRSET